MFQQLDLLHARWCAASDITETQDGLTCTQKRLLLKMQSCEGVLLSTETNNPSLSASCSGLILLVAKLLRKHKMAESVAAEAM